VRLDARRPLTELAEQWSECRACELGERRYNIDSKFVPGEGASRGIMIIGEAPGKMEEDEGRPACGRSGTLLRKLLKALQIEDVCYITNVVACRSCRPELDAEGNPITRRVRGVPQIKFRDQPPTPQCMSTCLPRLYEEIYLVDPLVIVTLGAPATSALAGRSVAILNEAGQEMHVDVPGVSQLASRTDKKGVWFRKVKGEWVAPTDRNMVRYLCIPTFHLGFIARSMADKSDTSPLSQFCKHLKTAALDYNRLAEIYGIRNSLRPAPIKECIDDVCEEDGGADDE
jgi:uracil-DNA glycosylase